MEEYHSKVMAHLTEIDGGLEGRSGELTLDTIKQTRQKLHSVILRLNRIHNSKLAIYRLSPCILYNIFAFAAYDPTNDAGRERTVLNITHVCHSWREAVLGWPVLWGFFTLDVPPSIAKLFINRSKNAPLTLSWTIRQETLEETPELFGFYQSTRSYLQSCADLIIPRLYSLTLSFPRSQLPLILDVFRSSEMPRPMLSLRYLDIEVDRGEWDSEPLSLEDFLRIDTSSLRELKLSDLSWPWLELPHHNLTSIRMCPDTLPSLSSLLNFLSTCPLLKELEYNIRDGGITTTSSSGTLINNLSFPNLERLILTSDGPSSYHDYIREILARIAPAKRLTQFTLVYHGCTIQSYNIFEFVPSGTFSDHCFLSIIITSRAFNVTITSDGEHIPRLINQYFRAISAPTDEFRYRGNAPLFISGATRCSLLFEESPILKVIHEMPQLSHLVLIDEAWKLLTFFETRIAISYLRVLEIQNNGNKNDHDKMLMSLPNGLKLGKLVLSLGNGEISFEILLDVVSRTEAKGLDLDKHFCNFHRDETEFASAITILRERGVDVIAEFSEDVNL